MGIVNVPVTVSNIHHPDKMYAGEFLVDTGAGYTVLPEKVWKQLGLRSEREQSFSLADGKIVKRNIGHAYVEYAGKRTPTSVVLGKKNDSALLGVIVLEELGLSIDPFQRKIYSAHLMM